MKFRLDGLFLKQKTIKMKIVRKSIIEDERNYWDITIPKTHTFILKNGTVVHNCGTGVGFSVERQFISKLPIVSEEFYDTDSVIKVRDSKIGWATALKELTSMLYQGAIPKWDLSLVRAAGEPLKIFGGRSSGPQPLDDLFKFFVLTIKNARGRKLNSIECNDLMCKIGETVVVGGVRRSACICLTNLSDDRMRVAKSGQWWTTSPQRALANISVAYTEKPEVGQFMEEWLSLYNSKSGERGIFNRVAAVRKIKSIGRRNPEPIREAGGINPCVTGDMIVDIRLYGSICKKTVKEVVELYKENKDIQILSRDITNYLTDYFDISCAELTRKSAKIVKISDNKGNFIRVTEDHLIFTWNKGYIKAKDIEYLDTLFTLSGNTVFNTIEEDGYEDVYDFTVPETSNFFINGILVHNCAEIVLRNCQFCVAEDTYLITDKDINFIKTYVDKDVNIWNGEEWTSVKVVKTGENQKLLRVHLSDGSYLDCTPYHRWSVKNRFMKDWKEVQAIDLLDFSDYSIQVEDSNTISPRTGIEYKDAYTLGFAVGDGCVYRNNVLIDLHGEKDINCPVKGNRHKEQFNHKKTSKYVRVNATSIVDYKTVSSFKNEDDYWFLELGKWNKESFLSFVSGLADADGTVVKSGGMRIYINSFEKCRAIQLCLIKHGIRCSVNLHQSKGTKTNLSIRKFDSWYVQITDCSEIKCFRLNTSNGHKSKYKGKYQNIVSVEELEGLHDTYCFNEPKKHKGMFNNILTHQCNLSEVIIRSEDTLEDILNKVRIATIIGTHQATLTNFRYLRSIWKKNTEEERLLGVSLTGIMDHEVFSGKNGDTMLEEWLTEMKEVAIETNKVLAEKLGINQSVAITTTKPSGTISQLCDTSSGIHPRYSEYYIRTVRSDNTDPLTKFMKDSGIPNEPDVTKPFHTTVFSFPIKSPENSVISTEIDAIEMLELDLLYNRYWTEHNVSITVYVREHEWFAVGAWVYDHFDEINGISFLPYSDHTYKQAPYQPITEEKYEEWVKKMPVVDWNNFNVEELQDNTIGSQTYACSGNSCEIL